MAQTFHDIVVSKKVKETDTSASIYLDIHERLASTFSYLPGQYLTIQRIVNGETLRRSYSLASAPIERQWRIIVKEVAGGAMSPWLVNDVNEGDQITVGVPEGRFVFEARPDQRRTHYFIAAGSGITPILSMLKAGLEAEPLSSFVLLYGNRSKVQTIAHDELQSLQETYGQQLRVIYAISDYKATPFAAVSRFFNHRDDGQMKGRIDAQKLKQLCDRHPTNKAETHFYLCGPGDMIEMAKTWIGQHQVGAEIHTEYFTNPGQEIDHSQSVDGATLHFEAMEGQSATIQIPKGKTLLEAIMDAGYDPPYSCMNGVCSSCTCRLTQGEVTMENNMALMDHEVEQGYILSCQSIPKTKELRISYADQ